MLVPERCPPLHVIRNGVIDEEVVHGATSFAAALGSMSVAIIRYLTVTLSPTFTVPFVEPSLLNSHVSVALFWTVKVSPSTVLTTPVNWYVLAAANALIVSMATRTKSSAAVFRMCTSMRIRMKIIRTFIRAPELLTA
jgi:hypothetical protein